MQPLNLRFFPILQQLRILKQILFEELLAAIPALVDEDLLKDDRLEVVFGEHAQILEVEPAVLFENVQLVSPLFRDCLVLLADLVIERERDCGDRDHGAENGLAPAWG